ncbi:unnamed protein product, partial [Meganyctiphanes norvegica]
YTWIGVMGSPCFIRCLLLLLLQGSIWITIAVPYESPSPPHIVFLLADDLGWNYVPWHNQKVIAPNLAELADAGVLLEQSYVQPVCSPSRSALMTGMYPFHLGRQSSPILAQQPSGVPLNFTFLPERLKDLGYSTHAIGKWHMGFCDIAYTPLQRGFDTFYGFYTGRVEYYNHTSCDLHIMHGYDFRDQEKVDLGANGTYSEELFTQRALEVINSQEEKNQPMFLYLPYQNVHGPFQVPNKFYNMYPNVEDNNTRIGMGMVSAMDMSVGLIVDALKDTGIYNNTIIVFSTDNGGVGGPLKDTNTPLRGSKATLWEGGTRGAAFVHSPLLQDTPRTYSGLMHITDWYNTLLSAAGAQHLPQNDGFNQWDAIRTGTRDSPRTKMIYNIDESSGSELYAAIRVGDYKFMMGEKATTVEPGPFLFNLKG